MRRWVCMVVLVAVASVALGALLHCKEGGPAEPGVATRAKQLAKTVRHGETAATRESAVVALGRLGRPESIDVLVEAARKDSNAHVRRRAAMALGRIRVARAAEMLGRLWRASRTSEDGVFNLAVQQSLIKLGDLALPALRHSLKHKSHQVRWKAIEALQQIGNPAAIEALRPLLSDPSPTVRSASKDAILALQARAQPRRAAGAQ